MLTSLAGNETSSLTNKFPGDRMKLFSFFPVKAVGGQERFYCSNDYDCVSGAFCHIKRFCKCRKGVAKTNGTFCGEYHTVTF